MIPLVLWLEKKPRKRWMSDVSTPVQNIVKGKNSSGKKGSKSSSGRKNKRNRSRIDHNILDDGSSITDRKVIKESFVKYYIDLSGSPFDDGYNSYVRIPALIGNRISDAQKEMLAGDVFEEQILSAFKSLNKNKAPGPHGYAAGFFKSAWNAMGDVKSVSLIREALAKFNDLSGLTPSLPKSHVFFSVVKEDVKRNILNLLVSRKVVSSLEMWLLWEVAMMTLGELVLRLLGICSLWVFDYVCLEFVDGVSSNFIWIESCLVSLILCWFAGWLPKDEANYEGEASGWWWMQRWWCGATFTGQDCCLGSNVLKIARRAVGMANPFSGEVGCGRKDGVKKSQFAHRSGLALIGCSGCAMGWSAPWNVTEMGSQWRKIHCWSMGQYRVVRGARLSALSREVPKVAHCAPPSGWIAATSIRHASPARRTNRTNRTTQLID
ncbi:hypothetical protein Acr_08g0011230 [Actinidia rufa]|uniref:Uncharacterized protein n=1 Tax=Actinidia rufa TaxID=165716 RepID=A0A7J0F484_9ERIC|nr:hypothetical protein Acr_08g0011230 [Actinidia rufa]